MGFFFVQKWALGLGFSSCVMFSSSTNSCEIMDDVEMLAIKRHEETLHHKELPQMSSGQLFGVCKSRAGKTCGGKTAETGR